MRSKPFNFAGNTLLATLLAIVMVLGSGCITSKETVFTEEASPDKALQRRVELARQYIGERDWDNAKRNLKLAVAIDDQNPEVHEAFALVYQSTGELELAEESFKKSISLNGKFSRARNNYAAFLFNQERFEEAEQQLNIVVKDTLYSGRPRAFVNLGLCRLQLFDPQGAEEALMRALSMDRTNAIALLEIAQLRFDAEDYARSEEYYGVYRAVVKKQSSRALWLGIRLARISGERDAEGSYALVLSNLYPQSPEYQAYQRERQE